MPDIPDPAMRFFLLFLKLPPEILNFLPQFQRFAGIDLFFRPALRISHSNPGP
jgi:hypothetical protein